MGGLGKTTYCAGRGCCGRLPLARGFARLGCRYARCAALCLCSNHHVLFDYGGFAIDDDWRLLGIDGRLQLHKAHVINPEHVHYHRTHDYKSI